MSVRLEQLAGCAFLAFDGYTDFLSEELANRFSLSAECTKYENLFYYSQKNPAEPAWAQTVLSGAVRIEFDSISEAANSLRQIQRNWAPYSFTQFRRTALIQEKLPHISAKPRVFPFTVPASNVGLWTLLDANTLLVFQKSSSPFPAGKLMLLEDHENPPSRAYLKLQEALVRFAHRFGTFPQKGECGFDAGASPGGWTWVLAQLGCSVFAVDRAKLAPNLLKNPLVTFTEHDAFTLPPETLGEFDWIFSDVICYPDRLFDWIQLWLKTGTVKNMICTVKMQGKTDWQLIAKFAAVSGGFLQHLHYNKHELTWLYCSQYADL